MRLRALLLVPVLALAGSYALAAEDPPNARRTVDFTVTWVAKGKTAVNHVFKASCQLIVGLPQDVDLDGKGRNQARQATAQELAAEMQKCGKNTQCIQRVAGKIQSSGVVNVEKNYVIWGDFGCSNMSLTADDTAASDGCSMGEGGVRCSPSTRTTKGTAVVQHCPNCIRFQHDLKKQITEYRFRKPDVPAAFDETTLNEGRQSSRKVSVLAFPDDITPALTLVGPPKSGKIIRPVPGGEATFEWTIKR
jgi:hypothetical protein